MLDSIYISSDLLVSDSYLTLWCIRRQRLFASSFYICQHCQHILTTAAFNIVCTSILSSFWLLRQSINNKPIGIIDSPLRPTPTNCRDKSKLNPRDSRGCVSLFLFSRFLKRILSYLSFLTFVIVWGWHLLSSTLPQPWRVSLPPVHY